MLRSLSVLTTGIMGAAAAYGAVDISSFSDKHVPGEMLITFGEHVDIEQQERLIASNGGEIIKRYKSSPTVLVKMSPEAPRMLDFATNFTRSLDVAHVGLNRVFTINAAPNDPSFGRQYHHDLIASEKAWEITTGTKDVTVAVIDSGITYDHPDLVANLWTNPGESGLDANGEDMRFNGIDDDNNGYVDDYRGWDFADNDNDATDDNGHGTHCAGSIGAAGDNGEGITGLNWNVSLIGLKFIGSNGQGTESAAIEAVEYATMMGFDLTSNSWGGDGEFVEGDPLYEAIKAAGEAGHLFVAAAGNDGRNTDRRPTLPASYDLENFISVASSDRRDRMSSFSNFGSTTVDIMAPGSGVYSTTKRGWFGRYYSNLSGTSMAAPLVAGTAALILSEYPDASPAELKQRILEGADKVSAGQGKLSTEGRLNIFNALTM